MSDTKLLRPVVRAPMSIPLRSVHRSDPNPVLEVVIEIPRGSFLKRGSQGTLDFVSPFPCPFNYGSVPAFIGLEGDLLDAVVLGPHLPRGTRLLVSARGAVSLCDRGCSDDKLICSRTPLAPATRRRILAFFHFYALCKGLLNLMRGQRGRNACDGWCPAEEALARARVHLPVEGYRPIIRF